MGLTEIEREVGNSGFDVRPMIGGSILPYMDDFGRLGVLRERVYDEVDRERMWEMRISSHDRCSAAVAQAEAADLPITAEEALMGQRKEWLEDEVRGAVLALLGKGYTTVYSGYDEAGVGSQQILFLSRDRLPVEVRRGIWRLTDETGILTFDDGPGILDGEEKWRDRAPRESLYLWNVRFIHPAKRAEEIRTHWGRITARMPDLGWKSIPRVSDHVQEFVRTHKLLGEAKIT